MTSRFVRVGTNIDEAKMSHSSMVGLLVFGAAITEADC